MKNFFRKLKNNRHKLTKQQFRTVKGQAVSGDLHGAEKGLDKLLKQYDRSDLNGLGTSYGITNEDIRNAIR